MPTQSRKIDEILVDGKFSSTLTSHEVIVSIKLYLDVRNDEYIILTILVAIPNPSPPSFPALSQEVIGEVWRHVTMIALLLDDNKTKDDGDGKENGKK